MISVMPTTGELRASLPGDGIVARPDVTMDRAFTVTAAADEVWPWIVQLGKDRAGWYFPRRIERVIPRSRRGLRKIDPRYQSLSVGNVIPDYGGADATFEVDRIEPGRLIVYRSVRGRMAMTWTISLTTAGDGRSRLHFRVILGPVKHRRLAEFGGGLFDYITILGLAAGLQERLTESQSTRQR